MDATDLARRINDNLHWSLIAGKESPDGEERPKDIWPQIELVLQEPEDLFVAGLYLVLLGRMADSDGMASLRGAMAAGMKRAEVVRNVALSDEARMQNLDVSWLSRLEQPPPVPHRSSFVLLKGAFGRLTAIRPQGVWARFKKHWRRTAS